MQANLIEIKVCVIGDTDVGKTSLSMRYCHGDFPENSTPTIGASFLQKRIKVEGFEMALQIWDTAGQERFRSMAPMYYRGAKAAILVFDLTNEESFQRAASWIRDLKAHADPDVVICLAGNKCDKDPSYDVSECESFASSVGAQFVRTSALTGEGVDQLFGVLSQNVYKTYKSKSIKSSKGVDVVKLNTGNDMKNSSSSATNANAPSSCC